MLYSSRDRGRHSSTPLLTQEEGNIPVHSLLSYSFTPPLSRQYLITEGIGHTRSDSNVAEIGVSYTRRYCEGIFNKRFPTEMGVTGSIGTERSPGINE